MPARFPVSATGFLSVLMLVLAAARSGNGQVIPFESNGLHYQALTRGDVTIMFAPLPTKVRDWVVFQVAITNGSPVSWTVNSEDFRFVRDDGGVVPALSAHDVVESLLHKASRSDTSKLLVAYEAALFNNMHLHSTNGYETRRRDALSEFSATKLSAAAAASAIVLAPIKLSPGQSTDGAVFYPTGGKPLGAGKMIANAAGEEFVFPMDAEPPAGSHK